MTDCSQENSPCCCREETSNDSKVKEPWITDTVDSPEGKIPRISTELTRADHIGWWKVRWAIARDRFIVQSGLYAVGSPDKDSDVFVTGNYKMSFDHLRRSLQKQNAWIMVLETFGINVWCAAGKGTFGTEEVINRINSTNLAKVVKHRNLILPQLSASGVSAHVVSKTTGFKITYGPVRANDIPAFLAAGKQSNTEMRRVQFGFLDRIVLTPVELVISVKYFLAAIVVVLIISGISASGYSLQRIHYKGALYAIAIVAGWFSGAFLGPILLPFLPGRSFSMKGIIAGLIPAAILFILFGTKLISELEWAGFTLISTAIASFLTMNFTGSSTYASPSGVRKEMKIFVPFQAVAAVAGAGIWIYKLFS